MAVKGHNKVNINKSYDVKKLYWGRRFGANGWFSNALLYRLSRLQKLRFFVIALTNGVSCAAVVLLRQQLVRVVRSVVCRRCAVRWRLGVLVIQRHLCGFVDGGNLWRCVSARQKSAAMFRLSSNSGQCSAAAHPEQYRGLLSNRRSARRVRCGVVAFVLNRYSEAHVNRVRSSMRLVRLKIHGPGPRKVQRYFGPGNFHRKKLRFLLTTHGTPYMWQW